VFFIGQDIGHLTNVGLWLGCHICHDSGHDSGQMVKVHV